MIGVFVCIATRFAQMFVITNLETIGPPLSMTMFSWNKQETVRYNSLQHLGFGAVSFVIYVFSVKYDLGKKINHRIGTICGLSGLVIFHLLTFPWWGMTRKIDYQQEYIEINGTLVKNPDPLGCKPSFDWCQYTPRINEYLYIISYMTICGLSFSLINVSMNTVFSTMLGPRNQGTMQGILLLSGSTARMCGPIFVANLFTKFGPRPAWAMEIVFAGTAAALWIIFYHRLVPLKLPEHLKQGERYKSKHGPFVVFPLLEDDEHIYVPARQCSSYCILPDNWAAKLVDSLIPLAKMNSIDEVSGCYSCYMLFRESQPSNDDELATCENFLDDYYPHRPNDLESKSLYNIVSNFRISKNSPKPRRGRNVDEIKGLANDVELEEQVEAEEIDEEELQQAQPVEGDGLADAKSCGPKADFLKKFGYHTDDPKSPFFQPKENIGFKLNKGHKWLIARTKPILLRVYFGLRDKDPEDYARRLLMLFKPYRREEELIESYESFQVALDKFFESCTANARADIERFLSGYENVRDSIFFKTKRHDELAEKMANEEVVDGEDEDNVFAAALIERSIDETSLENRQNNMNDEQKKVFGEVMTKVEETHKFKARQEKARDDQLKGSTEEVPTDGPGQLLKFVSGEGGSGKTYLIDVIADTITMLFRKGNETDAHCPSVLLAAPTGRAALYIKGLTLHSLLGIEVDSNKRLAYYQPLKSDGRIEIRSRFRNCLLLIIDEISMISNVMLTKIHMRLQDIMGNQKLFGGMSILFLGDLMQLPPVMSFPPFFSLSSNQIRYTFGWTGYNIDLWNEIDSYSELVKNMRQKGDVEFGQIVSRLRIGEMTDDDIRVLASRFITVIKGTDKSFDEIEPPKAATLNESVAYYREISKNDPLVIVLFGTLKFVEEFNEAVMMDLGKEISTIKAVDNSRHIRSNDRTGCVCVCYCVAGSDVRLPPRGTSWISYKG
ncbi:hypothetical protein WR25_02411 isoform E [Diploscapter pachys]|nr:hypothetical protein WR25_02411 isoform B [Diploscapter pachys]PAV63301.1 hypothetical protein WR25_02411 isoform C [Diploscapter pachys]PAV63302.1 hypothetical protein WR25_02411 isoform D [Diploscapter pachys]PAV63303.1 hypothetical protein WR25_02411 isoform E [Diploscapter pachys]